jgi:hypothetical protein
VEKLAEVVQQITGENVELAYVDRAHSGEAAKQAATSHGSNWRWSNMARAKRGLVLLPRRRAIEGNFAWLELTSKTARDDRVSKKGTFSKAPAATLIMAG